MYTPGFMDILIMMITAGVPGAIVLFVVWKFYQKLSRIERAQERLANANRGTQSRTNEE